jgi:uncharacterized protein YndB with AHSA1/START domain
VTPLRRSAIAAVLSAMACAAPAAVVDVSPTGFVVHHEAVVDAPPADVYRALTNVGRWWNPAHSHSKNAANLSIDARPGGCFCEKLAGGGGAEHMRVAIAKPGEVLRMVGALGPLQESGLAGSMTWTLAPAGASTKPEVVYSVGGYFRGGFDQIAPAVDSVVGEQLGRLERFVETGKPAEEPRH